MNYRNTLARAACLGAALLAPVASCHAESSPFHARNPADVLAVLTDLGAGGEIKTDERGGPYIKDNAGFEVEFYDCNDDKSACRTVIYAAGWASDALTLGQVNSWNALFPPCSAHLEANRHPRLSFYVVAGARDSQADVKAQFRVFATCFNNFDAFIKAPDAFLKAQQ